ncbi:hypothetical protein VPH35_058671 [Triticum aestivum]
MDDITKEWHDMARRDILKRRMLAAAGGCFGAGVVFPSGVETSAVDAFGAGVGTSAGDGLQGGDGINGGASYIMKKKNRAEGERSLRFPLEATAIPRPEGHRCCRLPTLLAGVQLHTRRARCATPSAVHLVGNPFFPGRRHDGACAAGRAARQRWRHACCVECAYVWPQEKQAVQAVMLLIPGYCEGWRCAHAGLYITVLSACGKGNDVLLGMQLHKRVIESGVLPVLKVENALVDMYAECGEMEAAWDLFEVMQVRNIVSWTSVICGCVRLGQVDRARVLFDRMPERDTVSWTAMIDGYVQAGQFREALEMFREMQLSKVRADEFTMVSIVTACTQLGALETGEWARIYMNRHGIKMDTFVGNALIDMYSKCGSIERALDVFNEMHSRDKFTWTAVILGLAVNGHGLEAIDMFDRMLRAFEAPDEVTFIGVLTACTHAGLVDKGRDFFLSMTVTYRIAPNVMHYGCIIDLLGRAGKLREALETIGKMPMKPNSAIWGTLLAACRVHGNSEIGELAAERLLELEPENSMAYVLLSNLYAKSNRWGDVRWLRQLMMEKGIKKEPGCSLIEMNGTIHEFVAGDRSHPMSEEIYSKLDMLLMDLKNDGYVPDVTEVFVQVTEEEKQKVLYWHSEKLAVAFALLVSESSVTIRIVKNLRMCLDCHNAIKLITKLYMREIVVRDRTRFHHFRHGLCSCKDYW